MPHQLNIITGIVLTWSISWHLSEIYLIICQVIVFEVEKIQVKRFAYVIRRRTSERSENIYISYQNSEQSELPWKISVKQEGMFTITLYRSRNKFIKESSMLWWNNFEATHFPICLMLKIVQHVFPKWWLPPEFFVHNDNTCIVWRKAAKNLGYLKK